MARKPRKGEHVCRCRAYKFPHRFGGARCSGISVVEQQWEENYGGGSVCGNCIHMNDDGRIHVCDVLEGREEVDQCPAWQEFVRFNEIKVGR